MRLGAAKFQARWDLLALSLATAEAPTHRAAPAQSLALDFSSHAQPGPEVNE